MARFDLTKWQTAPSGPRARLWLVSAVAIGCAASAGHAQEVSTRPSDTMFPSGEQVKDSTNQGAVPMDHLTLENVPPQQNVVPTPAEPQKRNQFIDDSKVSLQLRTFYFYRDKYDSSTSEAATIGATLAYKSGYLFDRVAVGAVGYTSQPLYAPSDHDGTLLLEPDQHGYTVLGQIYGEVKVTDRLFAAFGRKEYNTPFVNKNDTRMTPNTFEGASFYGTAGGEKWGKDGIPEWRFGGGYLSEIKERNSDEFVPMSEDAGAKVDRGVFLGGANVDGERWSLGGIDYYSDDIINIFYTEGKYSLFKQDKTELKVGVQFTDQRSVGDQLLTGNDFATDQYGVKADLTLGDAILTLGYTGTAQGADMRSPWGGYPGYTSVQVQDFFRAGEQSGLIRAGYDFTNLGLKGFSAYALWVHDFAVASPNHDEDEIDGNLQWTPPGGALRGMSFRIRYACVFQHGDGDPEIHDFRFIMNYDFPRP